MQKIPFQESVKQPDPQPPVAKPPQAPSILLYFVLTVIAIALITVAFKLNEPDWPGLLLGLATNFIAAVVLLVIIDRRLRKSELLAIREYAAAAPVKIAAFFSKDISIAITYSQTLRRELLLIRPNPYIERRHPSLKDLLDSSSKGFILSGAPGMGKSVLIQALATKLSEKVIRRPTKELIPIILPLREWKINLHLNDRGLAEQLWRKMADYTPVSRNRFNRWLDRKRLLIILDGLDEIGTDLSTAIREIEDFRNLYVDTSIIISTRPTGIDLSASNLPKIEIPRLTEEEIKELADLFFKK